MRWRHSRVAGFALVFWLGTTAVCGGLAMANPSSPWGNAFLTNWQTKHAVAFWYWVLLFAFSFGIHACDTRSLKKRGSPPWGFKYVRFEGIKAGHDTSDAVTGSMLTIQSIRAAITIGMLFTVVNSWRQSVNGDFRTIFETPFSKMLWSTLAFPETTMGALVLAALSCSIATTLAAIQCYDYSIRYDWVKAKKPLVKQALVGKAHGFTRYGFYSLVAALTASVAVVEPVLSIFTTLVVFLAMWNYYYFYEPDTIPLDGAVPEGLANKPTRNAAEPATRNPPQRDTEPPSSTPPVT